MKDIFELNNYTTPTTHIPCKNNELYVKRDDLLPFSFGGNKARIALEFIYDMYEKGMDCIVGYGNARSNLSRALANLCYQFSIPCHIISPADEDGTRIETFNSKIVQSCHAKFHYCTKQNVKETVENVLADLKAKGIKPYYIYGDSNGSGNEHTPMKAYRKVYEEIKKEYDYIFLASGTGMTQGGLLVGKSINKGKEKIVGISVARSSEREANVLKSMIDAYSNRVEKVEVKPEDIIVDDSYLCNGYGTYNRQIEKVISEQMMINGMPLDPTYTGKAFWGMLDYLDRNEIQGKKVLFIHTGGTPLFFDYENGIKLINVKDMKLIQEAVVALEGNLIPSLSERNVDLKAYAEKMSKYGRVWCHYDCGKPVSILAGYCNDEKEYTAYLSILSVNEEYRSKKFGTSLITEYELYAQECGMKKSKLEVRKNNSRAQAFYKKYGYQIIGDASETSYYMQKILGQSNRGGGRTL